MCCQRCRTAAVCGVEGLGSENRPYVASATALMLPSIVLCTAGGRAVGPHDHRQRRPMASSPGQCSRARFSLRMRLRARRLHIDGCEVSLSNGTAGGQSGHTLSATSGRHARSLRVWGQIYGLGVRPAVRIAAGSVLRRRCGPATVERSAGGRDPDQAANVLAGRCRRADGAKRARTLFAEPASWPLGGRETGRGFSASVRWNN